MERTEICGLKGIGSGTKGYRLIPLKNKKKVDRYSMSNYGLIQEF